jgi:aspartyl-tRNA(Asn)/glutamyl-tRNA(Gln) amidotransferase subunit C
MKIGRTQVEYVAALANLDVADDEKDELAEQLSRIVELVERLNGLDTDDVEPTSQVAALATETSREDRIEPRTGSSEAARAVGLFKVPRVITKR